MLSKWDVNLRTTEYQGITEVQWDVHSGQWSEERDKDKEWDTESEIWCESWDVPPLWLWATVWTPLSCTIFSLAETTCRESLASQLLRALPPLLQVVLCSWNPQGEVQGGAGRLRTHCTLIISCVTYRKMEPVEYSGAEHRNPGYQTQQLRSISAATEPTLSSYCVWYITMRWCDLTWQPMCRLSDLAEMYETLTKWGPWEELQYVWSLKFGWEDKT